MPWVFCLLLDTGTRAETLAWLKVAYEVIRTLRSSSMAIHAELLAKLHFLKWTVVIEVLELLQQCGWSLEGDSDSVLVAMQYIRALFQGLKNTLGLENGFNDLRDNEVSYRGTLKSSGQRKCSDIPPALPKHLGVFFALLPVGP